MLDHRQLYVACYFGSASRSDIEAFIQSKVVIFDEYNSRWFDVHANGLRVAQTTMIELIEAAFPEFSIYSDEGLLSCRAELKRQIRLLLDGEITPSTFCSFFNSMESALVVESELSAGDVDFLGDLYNACDWCDGSWTLENSPHLAGEAARVALRIEDAEPGGGGQAATRPESK